jgi:hypothetical protein
MAIRCNILLVNGFKIVVNFLFVHFDTMFHRFYIVAAKNCYIKKLRSEFLRHFVALHHIFKMSQTQVCTFILLHTFTPMF